MGSLYIINADVDIDLPF